MPSTDFQRRMETVLAARVAARARAERPRAQRTRQVAGALAATVAAFFLLKAAALATTGLPLAAPPAADSGFAATLYTWIAGPDPLTRTLALALRPTGGAPTAL